MAPVHCIDASRRQSTIFIREARHAGTKPPTSPISSANPIAAAAICALNRKRNAISEKVWKFTVETSTACISDAAPSPRMPPASASSSDSSRNAASTAPRRNPSARRVPISAVRLATAPNIVIIAPTIAPIEKIADSVVPRIPMNFASASLCSA